jgi:5-methylcytosine-specific restriction protein B
VLSLASKHASGEEFDRSLFTGGEKSPAFGLLRELHIQIERKDFVASLLEQFLKQASAANDGPYESVSDRFFSLIVSRSIREKR